MERVYIHEAQESRSEVEPARIFAVTFNHIAGLAVCVCFPSTDQSSKIVKGFLL
jgi:hypothetical protein